MARTRSTSRRDRARKQSANSRRADAETALNRFFDGARRIILDDGVDAVHLLDQKPLAWAHKTIARLEEMTQTLKNVEYDASSFIEKVIENADRGARLASELEGFELNDRVTVDGYAGQGTVRFIGPNVVKRKPRIGVELDDPNGKGEGTFGGHVYFKCREKHGLLVHPRKVQPVADSF